MPPSETTKPRSQFAPPGQGLNFWTVLYGLLGLYALYTGWSRGAAILLLPGSIFTLSSLGIWFGSSGARWLLFCFLVLMSGISIYLMATKGFQLSKFAVLLTSANCCLQLYLWNPALRGQELQ